MTERVTDYEGQATSRALELLRDTDTAWHAVNGFDFGACLSILKQGIEPSRQFGGREAVSLILSPFDENAGDHRTFMYYAGKSISFPVPKPDISANYGTDEIQYPSLIPRQYLKGIMIPEYFADTAIGKLPRLKVHKLSKIEPYINRQIAAIANFQPEGVEQKAVDQLRSMGQQYADRYDSYEARKKMADEINSFVLNKYEVIFGKILGTDQPTLRQAVKYLGAKFGLETLTLPLDFKP